MSDNDNDFKLGILKSYNQKKGYGFIEEDSDVFPVQGAFAHYTQFRNGPNPPRVGSLVRYRTTSPRQIGQLPLAVDVWVLKEETQANHKSNTAGV